MAFNSDIQDMGSLFYSMPNGGPAPPLGDGTTYSRALGWQSPEGNFYGQERWVRDWPSPVVWNGADYQVLDFVGSAASMDALPMPGQTNSNTGLVCGPRPYFEIWAIPRIDPINTKSLTIYDSRTLDFCWWDSSNHV